MYGSPQPQWQARPPEPPRGGSAGPIVAIIAAVVAVMVLFGGVVVASVLWMRTKSTATPTIGGPIITTSPTATGAARSDPDSPIPVTSKDPMLGDRTALVTIVLFSDFQCPFCQRLETTLSTLRSRYASSELRIVWKNNPLPSHAQAKPAAEAAEGVFEIGGNAAFWQFHDRVFANQSSMSPANFDAWASDTGIDMTKFRSGLAAAAYIAKVDEDVRLAATLGVNGTPTCFVNGVEVVGAQPLASFEKVVDDELAKARAKVAAGTPLDRVYVTMSTENFARPSWPTFGSDAHAPGLVTTDLVIGTGSMAMRGDKLTVHYVGMLDDGTVFDSSRKHGTPFRFELGAGQVIKGWDSGLVGMRVGGKRKLVIPPELAYGAGGAPPLIPPNARLTFEVELLSIK
jgi:FKBP-type peptidyl-prolyl cis-trans isomerase